MEGNSNHPPNEQGGDSIASNANERKIDPDLRRRVVYAIVEKLKICFPTHRQNDIKNTAITFESKVHGMATDKGDYIRKIGEKITLFERKFRMKQSSNVQSGSSVNGTNTADPAQALNNGQSLPTSLPYTNTPTSEQWLPQTNNGNPNIPESSGMRTQVSITVSAAKNVNIQMGEGVHSNLLPGPERQIQGREHLLPQQQQAQQQPQSSNYFQNQMDQQLGKENIRHGNLRPPYMQQQAQQQQQQQSMSKQKRQEREQLMNGHEKQQSLLTSRQNNGEQQGDFRVSSSQQNNMSSFQEMAQSNNNLQNVHQQQRLHSYSNNASALPSQQLQYMASGQSGNYNVHEASLLGTQGQEVGQSQPMMRQSQPMMRQQYQTQHPLQQQQPQNRILQQLSDDTPRFQASGSLRQTRNIADQQNQPDQFQANPSTSQDSSGKTVKANGGDWQEETYQKIIALKNKHLPVLSALFQKLSDKLRQIDSLPQQNMPLEAIQKLKAGKSTLELVLVFLNVCRSSITEMHRDRFNLYEEQVLKFTKNHQTGTRRPMQKQQQGQLPSPQLHQTSLQSQSGQLHVLQSLDNDQTNSRLMPSHQNLASSSVSGLTQKQFHHLPTQQQVLQKQQQQPQTNHQQLQIPQSEMNDVRMRQGGNIKAGLLQQNLSSCQRQFLKRLASPENYPSPQLVDQHILPTTCNKAGTSVQSGCSPFVAPSPVTSFAPSPNPGDREMPISVETLVSHAQEHPLFNLPPEPNAERPIDRLIKAFQSSSPESLAQSLSEMSSVISLTDMLAGPVHSIGGPKAGLAEDLSGRTRCRLQQEETNSTKRLKRSFSTMPIDIASEIDSYRQFSSLDSEVDSTASSGSKVNKVEQPGCALLQEINEVNGRLVETVVRISNEDGCISTSGTIVTCSYTPVALSATFEALYNSGQIIQPLRLLVPASYPHSPILIENIFFDASVHIHEDLSERARSSFALSMNDFPEPMSLTEIAQAWEDCARATLAEYAERHGGGTFSSKYGRWEPVLRAT